MAVVLLVLALVSFSFMFQYYESKWSYVFHIAFFAPSHLVSKLLQFHLFWQTGVIIIQIVIYSIITGRTTKNSIIAFIALVVFHIACFLLCLLYANTPLRQ
jgi:hypothetical protein